MFFENLRPILWTVNLEETIAFYSNMLGFTCRGKNDDWGWASMYKDGVEIMFAKPNAHSPFEKPVFTGSFYINVDNVEEIWNKLKDTAHIVYPIETFEWEMKEFAIYDNNGYILQFGQPVA